MNYKILAMNIGKLHKMHQIIVKNISNIRFCESCFNITVNKNFLCTICKKMFFASFTTIS